MTRLKYVITEFGNFAIFNEGNDHNDVARGLYGRPDGAGFCTIAQKADRDDLNIHCFGESVSLGIKSREEDEKIINLALNPNE